MSTSALFLRLLVPVFVSETLAKVDSVHFRSGKPGLQIQNSTHHRQLLCNGQNRFFFRLFSSVAMAENKIVCSESCSELFLNLVEAGGLTCCEKATAPVIAKEFLVSFFLFCQTDTPNFSNNFGCAHLC